MARTKKDRTSRPLVYRNVIKELLEEQAAWEESALLRPHQVRLLAPRQRYQFGHQLAGHRAH